MHPSQREGMSPCGHLEDLCVSSAVCHMHVSVSWSPSFLDQPLWPRLRTHQTSEWERAEEMRRAGACPSLPSSRSKELGHRGGGREMRRAGELLQCPLGPATLGVAPPPRLEEDSAICKDLKSPIWKDPPQLDLRSQPGDQLQTFLSSGPQPPPPSAQH